jgi:hypothetical protein
MKLAILGALRCPGAQGSMAEPLEIFGEQAEPELRERAADTRTSSRAGSRGATVTGSAVPADTSCFTASSGAAFPRDES